MNSSMMELLFGKEAIERAKKRGRAYMCLVCHQLTGERRVGELGPMEDHVLKTHVSRDRVPFYCRLCMFKCQTKQQMDHHTRHYSRHVTMARTRGIVNHEEWQVQSPVPYKIGEAELMKFSQGESALFFLKRQTLDVPCKQTTAVNVPHVAAEAVGEKPSTGASSQGYNQIPEQPTVGNCTTQLVGRPDFQSTFSPTMAIGLRQYTGTGSGFGSSPLQHSPMIETRLKSTGCLPLPGVSSRATPLSSPDYRLLATPEPCRTVKSGTILSFPQQPIHHEVSLIHQRAEGTLSPIFTAHPLMIPVTSEVTIQPVTAPVDEHPSPAPSFCSAAVRPTSATLAETPLRLNTVDMKGLVYEGTEPDKQTEEDEEVEDLWSQLMSKDDLAELTGISSLSDTNKKRKAEEEKNNKAEKENSKGDGEKTVDEHNKCGPTNKKRKTTGDETIYESYLLALNSLTASIQNLSSQMTRNTEKQEKTEKALVEMFCFLSKVTDALNRMRNVLEESLREERRREERWNEMERRREEERRKDREADQRREDRRREAERKEREEIKRLLRERKDAKENARSMKSVLRKSYTENSVKEYGKKK